MPRWTPEPDHMIDIYSISKRTGESVANIRNMLNRGQLIDARPTRRGHRLYYNWSNLKWQFDNRAKAKLKKLIY